MLRTVTNIRLERLCHHPATRKQCPTGKVPKVPTTNSGGAAKVEGGFLQYYFLKVKESAKVTKESNLVSGKMCQTCYMIQYVAFHILVKEFMLSCRCLCVSARPETDIKRGAKTQESCLASQVTLIWRKNQIRTSPSGPSPHHPWRRRQMSMKRWGNFQFGLGEVSHQTIF